MERPWAWLGLGTPEVGGGQVTVSGSPSARRELHSANIRFRVEGTVVCSAPKPYSNFSRVRRNTGPCFRVKHALLSMFSRICKIRYDKVVSLLVNADLVRGGSLAVTGPLALVYALMDGRSDTSIPLTSRCLKPRLTSRHNEVTPSSHMFDI